ncbi:MAG: PRC-barrel domain-containing protein [Pseudomonadota bacterium]|nr:PRC-barrel domain-containing protein [Pseudomonadota bacterium]
MKMSILVGATALLLAQAASAQTASPRSPNAQNQKAQDQQQKIQTDLQQSGFSDVKVMPESFLVRAKDKSGNPIVMIINPDSVSEIVTDSSDSGAGTFITPSGDKFGSNLVGLDVYDNNNQDIGKIKDLAIDQTGSAAYVISVRGILGNGPHYVAVIPSAVNWTYDASAKKWRATMVATGDQLKAAPQFNYDAARKSNKS